MIKSSNFKPYLFSPFLFLIILTGCDQKKEKDNTTPISKNEDKKVSDKDLTQRGEYLVNTIGCADCHSPKKMGERGPEVIGELSLSGHMADQEIPAVNQEAIKNGWMLMNSDLTAAAGPWGVSFAANITSDETGIGNWTLEQFMTAIREGKYKGQKTGRDILPPMPWQNFAMLSDEDLKAMFLYLKSTKPVKNAVPAPIPPGQDSKVASK